MLPTLIFDEIIQRSRTYRCSENSRRLRQPSHRWHQWPKNTEITRQSTCFLTKIAALDAQQKSQALLANTKIKKQFQGFLIGICQKQCYWKTVDNPTGTPYTIPIGTILAIFAVLIPQQKKLFRPVNKIQNTFILKHKSENSIQEVSKLMKVKPIDDLLVTRNTHVFCLRVPMINGTV